MRGGRIFKTAALVFVALVSVAWAGRAWAGSAVLTLHQITISTTTAGVQTEGGSILKNGAKIGQYAIQRIQVPGGTSAPFNTSMATVSLFFAVNAGTGGPEVVTMQGAHDFNSSIFRGSVSAASNFYAWIKGADASYAPVSTVNKTLIISWTGLNQFALP